MENMSELKALLVNAVRQPKISNTTTMFTIDVCGFETEIIVPDEVLYLIGEYKNEGKVDPFVYGSFNAEYSVFDFDIPKPNRFRVERGDIDNAKCASTMVEAVHLGSGDKYFVCVSELDFES